MTTDEIQNFIYIRHYLILNDCWNFKNLVLHHALSHCVIFGYHTNKNMSHSPENPKDLRWTVISKSKTTELKTKTKKKEVI